MRATRRVALASGLGLMLTLGTLVAVRPAVSYWRVRYWIEPSARCVALGGLMRATDTGGSFELAHAARSGNDLLRRAAAGYLAERGDRDGVRTMVDLCYEFPDGHLKFSPRAMLAEQVQAEDLRLAAHRDADAWWTPNAPRLRYTGAGRWRLD
jgi:hypothetical protein